MTIGKRKYSEWLTYILICAMCIYVLMPILKVASYNRPVRDDYTYGLLTREVLINGGSVFDLLKAAIQNVVNCYTALSGLYTSAFVLSLHPGVWGEKCYTLSTYIVMAVVYFYTFCSVSIINRYYIKRSVAFTAVLSLVLDTVLFLWLPGPREGLYWYNGAMNYMPYVFMNFTNIMLLVEVKHCRHLCRGKIAFAVSMVLSFLISGGNQVTAFANILMLLYVAIYMASKKELLFSLPLASACVGFLVMLLSPGTGNRQELFEQQTVLATVIATVRYVIKNVSDWMSLKWFISLALVTPVAMDIAMKNRERFSRHFPVVQILLSGMVICGMLCVPYYPMGWFGSGRIINVIWITFMVLSWYIYVLIWGYLVKNQYINMEQICKNSRLAVSGALVLICVFVLYYIHDGTMSNSMLARHELASGIVSGYAQEMDDRIAMYKDETMVEIGVAPIENQSILLCGKELSEDPDEWPNSSMGEWYNKKIYLIPKHEE